jgi:HPt (histidine-containing phosphotransfer) domain-containing protein
MTVNVDDREAIYSSLDSDPDLGEIVAMFVAEMPGRVKQFTTLARAGDWAQLQTAAHQLKGAAGSYGFAPITPLARRLEMAIREEAAESEIRIALDALVSACRRVRYGRPEVVQ